MKKNVKLLYDGKIRKVRIAVNKANEILADPEFYNQIRAYTKFNENDLSPDAVSKLMEESEHRILVNVSFVMPIASAQTMNHDEIRVSYWNFNKALPAGVNTLVHHTVNAIDIFNAIKNNNRLRKKFPEGNSAPWVIGAIAEIMVK